MIKHTIKLSFLSLLLPGMLIAQNTKQLSLPEAIELGLNNSKNLKLSQSKIDEALSRLAQIKDGALPSAKASFMYNHAEIPANTLSIGADNPIRLPNRADALIGNAGVEELIYGGGRLKYAEASTRLLTEVARLDADKDREEISYAIINTYYSLFKVLQSKKVVLQNLEAIEGQLHQSQRFFEQGIVTKNDVLRFQLQQANVKLTDMEIENNRKIINYNMDILLGLEEHTQIEIADPGYILKQPEALSMYMDMAMNSRQELKQLGLQTKVADINIRSIKANTLPTIGLGANLYYINPGGKLIPAANEFIVPITLGANISWNIGSLWTSKNKISEAQIQIQTLGIQKDILADQVKREVNKNYQDYQFALNKILLLETSIAQAEENDHLLESKYKNNVASAIDRIDAETLLYQAKINLELARADAGLAYYTLLKSTGKTAR